MGARGADAAARHRAAFIAGLRELADLLESCPALPVPFPAQEGAAHLQPWVLGEGARERFDLAVRALGVQPETSSSGSTLRAHRRLGAADDPVIGLSYAVVLSSAAG